MRYLIQKISVIVIILGSSYTLHSQNFNYSKSVQSSAFTFLNDSLKTIVIDNTVWDDNDYRLPIGFSFVFAGQSFDSLTVRTNGTFTFDTEAKYNFITLFKDFICESDLNNRSLSPISRELITLANGTKRLKIEFKNAAFYTSAGVRAHIDFQLWLNQQDNSIEFHMGAGDAGIANESCLVGLLNMNNTNGGSKGYLLRGAPASPAAEAPGADHNIHLSNIPTSGTVYVFNPNAN